MGNINVRLHRVCRANIGCLLAIGWHKCTHTQLADASVLVDVNMYILKRKLVLPNKIEKNGLEFKLQFMYRYCCVVLGVICFGYS